MSEALKVVAYLPIRHRVDCATFDPDHGPCDCGARAEPLVRLRDAQAAIAASNTCAPSADKQAAHTDHPLRHFDRTCTACVTEADKQAAGVEGRLKVAVGLLRDAVGPLEAACAIVDDPAHNAPMEVTLGSIQEFVKRYDRAALSAPQGDDARLLEAVAREMKAQGLDGSDGNAPGHGHEVPGIWDDDNGELAGQPCAWCLTWQKFTALVNRAAISEAAKGEKKS